MNGWLVSGQCVRHGIANATTQACNSLSYRDGDAHVSCSYPTLAAGGELYYRQTRLNSDATSTVVEGARAFFPPCTTPEGVLETGDALVLGWAVIGAWMGAWVLRRFLARLVTHY